MDIADSKTDTMHILDEEGSCWCEPKRVEVEGSENVIWIHRDIKTEGN